MGDYHTKVKLLETCLNRIFQTDTPSISWTLFGPSRARRRADSAPESPWLFALALVHNVAVEEGILDVNFKNRRDLRGVEGVSII